MEATPKTGFFKHYTFKRWMIHSACCFAFISFCDLTATLVFDDKSFQEVIDYKNILAVILTSLLVGFFSCLVKVHKKQVAD
jgi:hypothetical protein